MGLAAQGHAESRGRIRVMPRPPALKSVLSVEGAGCRSLHGLGLRPRPTATPFGGDGDPPGGDGDPPGGDGDPLGGDGDRAFSRHVADRLETLVQACFRPRVVFSSFMRAGLFPTPSSAQRLRTCRGHLVALLRPAHVASSLRVGRLAPVCPAPRFLSAPPSPSSFLVEPSHVAPECIFFHSF